MVTNSDPSLPEAKRAPRDSELPAAVWGFAGGGLLLSLPKQNVDQCLQLLAKEGFASACVIGEVLPANDAEKPVGIA
jgi:hypothetical protein